ncbi:hypothetical protein [Haloplanus aerogenes]|uniref:Uncharacterized protein n=1 Tax=Haloplanus aerogenes TaxID=660522 RepID=A0A3M0DRD5_9EURY|nr:hypothetical protein [Haloplanus aerogenes]RMB23985.1 hypothetical protein ATH50_1217 [Haloplanus aerogenes]
MNRRYFVTATATAVAMPLAGCTGPEDGEDGGDEGENGGGSGPYGKVDGHTRPPIP